ncbi:MAG TPA: hypothetical protein VFP80_06585, partial [Thermoanaerobaculia bacterium]|nr:hypothetical protein [Thermoanaerobaculia bacterium]
MHAADASLTGLGNDPARLAVIARGRGGEEWPLRRRAALMLEHLFWISETRVEETAVLSHLGAAIDPAWLRGRTARNARIHAALRDAAPGACDDFLHLAGRESRLVLAPWLFTAAEVAARITGRMRSSRAAIQPIVEIPDFAAESARVLAELPEWERTFASMLARSPLVYWASPEAEDGDLVATPPGTVVLTVNPPGSDLEIEIKRTGRPAPRPLTVVYERDGQRVPPTHRLDGGTTWNILRFEAIAATRLSVVWRALHGEEAPICRTIAVKIAETLPDGARELPVHDYFVEEAARDPREDGTMARAVRAFCAEELDYAPVGNGETALASRFLLHAAPAQSVIVGTAAWRLDRVATALGSPESVRLAAELLDEVFGVFEPPATHTENPAEWLDAVFARPANAERAAELHRGAAARLGSLWGTFFALGLCSFGESVVGRNVGLKAVFRAGAWTAELISMDHDNLRIAGTYDTNLDPDLTLGANLKDEIALFGGMYKGARVRGSLELLDDIYRADEAGRAAARASFSAAARAHFERAAAATEPGGAA